MTKSPNTQTPKKIRNMEEGKHIMSPPHNMIKARIVAALSLMAATVTVVANLSAAEKVDTERSRPLPQVLPIGDSIRGGYQHGTKELVKELQEEFVKLKFGMFIHFNMATYKQVQWVSGYPDPCTFNPGQKGGTTFPGTSTASGLKAITASVVDRISPGAS